MVNSSRSSLEQSGELKLGQVGVANLRIHELDIERLGSEMRERVERVPNLFERAALVVDFGSLSTCPSAEQASELIRTLRDAGVRPVALAFGTTEIEALSRQIDLPLMAKFRAQYDSPTAAESVPTHAPVPAPAPAAAAPAPVPAAYGNGMLIRQTVRSGQQIYAQGRDLTVCGGVSAGAEIIADGNVHVYGALRGRALAGAHGDEEVRIFCREFHAELVSIAGQYKVLEELPSDLRGRAVQVWLEDGKLRITEL